MPRLWQDSMEAHRGAVRDAALDAADALISEHGLPALTMSRVAQDAGIGRATLYKYFPDMAAVLSAWHERQVRAHVQLVVEAAASPGGPSHRLRAVLIAYAGAARRSHGRGLAVLLHQSEHVVRAQHHLQGILAILLEEGVAAGEVRGDVAPNELAVFCLHALAAAGALPSAAAVQRLVGVTLSGLAPEPPPAPSP